MNVHRCVGAVVVRGDAVLLGLRAATRTFYPDVWDLIGGHIDGDEQPEQTLVRELEEELGITPVRWAHLETVTLAMPDQNAVLHYHLFVVTAWDGTPTNRQPDEHARVEWWTLAEIEGLPLAHPAYPQLIARALRR